MWETGSVADHCTCGAELPPDARFCHKCGKPQRDEPLMVEEEAPPPVIAPPPQPALPPEISFHNRIAVRIGMLAAALVFLLSFLSTGIYTTPVWIFLWLFAAGFVAVYIYRRRTGQTLSVRSGARLGWITGIFSFTIATILLAVVALSLADSGGITGLWKQQLDARGAADPNVKQAIEALQSPEGTLTLLLFTVLMMFFLFTLVPTLGAAFGAKVLDKGSTSTISR